MYSIFPSVNSLLQLFVCFFVLLQTLVFIMVMALLFMTEDHLF